MSKTSGRRKLIGGAVGDNTGSSSTTPSLRLGSTRRRNIMIYFVQHMFRIAKPPGGSIRERKFLIFRSTSFARNAGAT